MNILIIEDELRASQQLQFMLEKLDDTIHLLAILESVEDSVAWFEHNNQPDLIFMDIQLADGLSFEIFQQTVVEAPVIFTTAYDQYSIKAFKVNSIDYLLKPFQESDLFNALNKYKSLYEKRANSAISTLTIEQLLKHIETDESRKRFMVKEGNSLIYVQVESISFFYSEDGISFLVTKDGHRYIVDFIVDQIEKQISKQNFFRINRGQIINLNAILKIHPHHNHRLNLEVKHSMKQEFIVSRNRTREFKEWINK